MKTKILLGLTHPTTFKNTVNNLIYQKFILVLHMNNLTQTSQIQPKTSQMEYHGIIQQQQHIQFNNNLI